MARGKRGFYGNKKSLKAKRLMFFSTCEKSELVWGPRRKGPWWAKLRILRVLRIRWVKRTNGFILE